MSCCASCKFWKEAPNSEGRFGFCAEVVKVSYDGPPRDTHRADGIILADAVDAYVGKEFGCNRWSNKYTPETVALVKVA